MLQTNKPLFKNQENLLNTVPERFGEYRDGPGSGKEQDGSDVRVHCVTGVSVCAN